MRHTESVETSYHVLHSALKWEPQRRDQYTESRLYRCHSPQQDRFDGIMISMLLKKEKDSKESVIRMVSLLVSSEVFVHVCIKFALSSYRNHVVNTCRAYIRQLYHTLLVTYD